MINDAPLVDVADLTVRFDQGNGQKVTALDNVSFSIGRERLGLIGESGSGKSTIARALLGLLPGNALVAAKTMSLNGIDIAHASTSRWIDIRRRQMAFVPQDARSSLNPVMTIGRQLVAALRLRAGVRGKAAKAAALAALQDVHIADPVRVLDLYPHQVSGGMAQRVMLAMMLTGAPQVIVADEPTSALDAIVRFKILDLLTEIVAQRAVGLILISHDLELVTRYTDRVVVLRNGQVVESGTAQQLPASQHPYTRRLLDRRPRLDLPDDPRLEHPGQVGPLDTVGRRREPC